VRTIGNEDTIVFGSWAFPSGPRALITKRLSNDDAGLVLELIDVPATGDPRVVVPALNSGEGNIAVAFGAPTRVGWMTGGTTLHVARDPADSTSAWIVDTLESPEAGSLALVLESNGRLAGTIATRPLVESTSGEITIGDPIFGPGTGNLRAAAAVLGSSGRAVVFLTVDNTSTPGNRIWRAVHAADGTWTAEDIAENPGGYSTPIYAFSDNALLVVSTIDEPGGFPLHYVHRNGVTWESEIAATAEFTRGVTVAGGDASPAIVFGIDSIYLATRTGGVWTSSSTPLADLGSFRDCEDDGDGGACGCSLRARPPDAIPLLLLATTFAAAFAFRRRR
jgi:hypothetical protein